MHIFLTKILKHLYMYFLDVYLHNNCLIMPSITSHHNFFDSCHYICVVKSAFTGWTFKKISRMYICAYTSEI